MPPSRRRRAVSAVLGASAVAAGVLGGVAAVGGVVPTSRASPAVREAADGHGHAAPVPAHRTGGPTDARGSAGATRAPAHAAMEAATMHNSAEDLTLEHALADRLSRATARRVAMVVYVDGIGQVADLDGGQSMLPASTQKLFTTLPLLLQNPQRRLVTRVYAAVAPRAGVVHGNLVVHAASDPSLARPAITSLAEQVRAAGIRRVTGHLVLDIGGLPMSTTRDGWKPDMVPSDIGPLSPLPVRSDTLRHDGWYVAHPTWGNLNILRSLFAARGVRIVGPAQIVRQSRAQLLVASHSSPPMAAMVRHTLRWSDNFWAESLLNVEGGHAPVYHVASAAGVSGDYATDGSGLSYSDRETVQGEVALLRYAYSSAARSALWSALPVACRTGTLQHEFCGTAAAGKVFAKTGTLDHVKALAGYTTDARGRLVTFAVLCNGVRDTNAAARAIERAVVVLRNYRR